MAVVPIPSCQNAAVIKFTDVIKFFLCMKKFLPADQHIDHGGFVKTPLSCGDIVVVSMRRRLETVDQTVALQDTDFALGDNIPLNACSDVEAFYYYNSGYLYVENRMFLYVHSE